MEQKKEKEGEEKRKESEKKIISCFKKIRKNGRKEREKKSGFEEE